MNNGEKCGTTRCNSYNIDAHGNCGKALIGHVVERCVSYTIKKGPGGCKPKLPDHLKRKVDTIGILPSEWKQLDEIGPSRGKAVSKLLLYFNQPENE